MDIKNEIIRLKLNLLIQFFNLSKNDFMKILKVQEKFDKYNFTKISGMQVINLLKELNVSCDVLEEIFILGDFDEERILKKLNGFKENGVKRKIDELGRVVLPKEMREALNIKNYDFMDISLNKDRIFIIKPIDKRCLCCGRNKNLRTVNNTTICKKCIKEFEKEII